MTNYRRNFIAGGSLFFSVNLAERQLSLLTSHVDQLRNAIRDTRKRHPFTIDAIVVLPDHLHAVWTLPEGDADFATRWRLIKSTFSRSISCGERISASRGAKGERGIWQRRYWEHTIRNEADFERHVDYIHQSGQAWSGDTRAGLAAFVVSSDGRSRNLSRRLGRRYLRRRRSVWRKVVREPRGDGFRCAQPILRALNHNTRLSLDDVAFGALSTDQRSLSTG